MAFMTFNKEQAEKAGAQRFETGAHTGLMQAEMITASTGTKGMEFNLHGQSDVSYISIYYELHDGTELKGGMAFIQAFMAIFRVNEINVNTIQDNETGKQKHIVHEFMNKNVGMLLQKVLYTKQDGDDGYKVELVMPFCAKTRKTAQELLHNKPAETIDKILLTLKDKDERTNKAAGGNNASNSYGMAQDNATASRPSSKFDQVNQNQGGFQQQPQQRQQQTGGFSNQPAYGGNQNQQAEPNLDQSDAEFFS